ncbi:hypothetical protein HDU96_003812 [Phlyctochytrium bullatum]|nr:hypothetical protein HDU96_003812 [Phlyctochytrium bullatum]
MDPNVAAGMSKEHLEVLLQVLQESRRIKEAEAKAKEESRKILELQYKLEQLRNESEPNSTADTSSTSIHQPQGFDGQSQMSSTANVTDNSNLYRSNSHSGLDVAQPSALGSSHPHHFFPQPIRMSPPRMSGMALEMHSAKPGTTSVAQNSEIMHGGEGHGLPPPVFPISPSSILHTFPSGVGQTASPPTANVSLRSSMWPY